MDRAAALRWREGPCACASWTHGASRSRCSRAARGRSSKAAKASATRSRIENRSAARIEAVATVDGLDVFDGRHGSVDKRGYVLEPWSTFRIDGFRQNMGEVAAFRFGAVRDSYAAQKGDDSNVGVIGVAFFGARGAPPPSWLWPDRETARRLGADPFPGRFAEPPAEDRW